MQRHAGTLPPSKRTGASRRGSNRSNGITGGAGGTTSSNGSNPILSQMHAYATSASGGVLDLGSGGAGSQSSPSHRSSSTDDDGSSSPLSSDHLGVPPSQQTSLSQPLLQTPAQSSHHHPHHSNHLLHQRGLIGSMSSSVVNGLVNCKDWISSFNVF